MKRWLTLLIVFAGVSVTAGVAIALGENDGEGQDGGPDLASLSAQATKAAEAAQPTPTTIPASGTCPAANDVCEFGVQVAGAVRGGSPAAVLALSQGKTMRCEAEQAVAVSPLCDAGGTQTGYVTSSLTRFQFRNFDDFVHFLFGQVGADANGSVSLASVGCPGESLQEMNCSELALLTVARVDDRRGVAGGNSAPIILIAQRDTSGMLRVVGGQSSFSEHPSFRGGNHNFAQYGISYRGPVWFVPVDLE